MAYRAFYRLDGADVGVATEKVTDNLIIDTIILRCEGERGTPGLIKCGIGSGVKGGGIYSQFLSVRLQG